MREEADLLEATARRPAEDEPRLAYAEWLERRDPGDPLAKFIRGQIAVHSTPRSPVFASSPVSEAEYAAEEARVAAWHEAEAYVKAEEVAARKRWREKVADFNLELHRGFPMTLAIQARDFLAHGKDIVTRAPIVHLRLFQIQEVEAAVLFRDPSLSRLWALDLNDLQLGDAEISALSEGPELPDLTWLDLRKNRITLEGWRALARSKRFPTLRWVGIEGNSSEPAVENGFLLPSGYDEPNADYAKLLEEFGAVPWFPSGNYDLAQRVPEPLAISEYLLRRPTPTQGAYVLVPALVVGFFGRFALLQLQGKTFRGRSVLSLEASKDIRVGDRIEVSIDPPRPADVRYVRHLGPRAADVSMVGDPEPSTAPPIQKGLSRGRVCGLHGDLSLVQLIDGTKAVAYHERVGPKVGDFVDVNLAWPIVFVVRIAERVAAAPSRKLPAPMTCVSIDPEGRRVLCGDDKGHLGLWNFDEGGRSLSWQAHAYAVTAVAFHGNRILSAGEMGEIRVWDAETGEILGNWLGHDARVVRFAFDGGGKRVVTAASREVRLWDAETGQCLRKWDTNRGVEGAGFHPEENKVWWLTQDEFKIVEGDRVVTSLPRQDPPGLPYGMDFLGPLPPDGLLFQRAREGLLRLDLRTLACGVLHPDCVGSFVAVHPDGRIFSASRQGEIGVLGTSLRSRPFWKARYESGWKYGADHEVWAVAWHFGRGIVAFACSDGLLRVCEIESGKEIPTES